MIERHKEINVEGFDEWVDSTKLLLGLTYVRLRLLS